VTFRISQKNTRIKTTYGVFIYRLTLFVQSGLMPPRGSQLADTREKLSPLTVAFHWFIGLTIISMLALGVYMEDLPRSEWRSTLIGWHKVIGTTVLMVAALRLLWRWWNGLPKPAGFMPPWQHKLASAVHILLLVATIALPLSGALYSYGAGYPVPVLGLFNITPDGKTPWLDDIAGEAHEIFEDILIAIISLHVLGALKHHVVDKDGTLSRMLGARIS
jgi:cytochrome b561